MELGFIIGYCSGIVISLLIDIIIRFIEGDVFEDERKDNWFFKC